MQADSPAAAAGIRPADLIVKVDGKSVDDPLTLPGQLNPAAGKIVNLTIRRKGETLVVPVRARRPVEFSPSEEDSPIAVPSLGIAYRVLNQVDHVIDGSPAAKAGLQPEDVIVRAKRIPPAKEVLRKLEFEQAEIEIPFARPIATGLFFCATCNSLWRARAWS